MATFKLKPKDQLPQKYLSQATSFTPKTVRVPGSDGSKLEFTLPGPFTTTDTRAVKILRASPRFNEITS